MGQPGAGGRKKWEPERSKRHVTHKIREIGRRSRKGEKYTGYITKEELGRQKVLGLKKAVDVSLTGRMA